MKKVRKLLALALALVLALGGMGQAAVAADGDLIDALVLGAFVNSFTDNVMDIYAFRIIVNGDKNPVPEDVTDIVIYYNGAATPVEVENYGYMGIRFDGRNDTAMDLVITPTLPPLPGSYYVTFKYRGVSYGSSTAIVAHTGIGGTTYDTSTFDILDGGTGEPNPPAPTLVANPTASTVYVNGVAVAFDAYNINDNNYFKLRDIAYILSGTTKQFEVQWDGDNNTILLISGQSYTPVGVEMVGKGAGAKTPAPTSSKIFKDGAAVSFTAYNIEDNNYFKLRDIGEAFDFEVDWDGENNAIIIDTTKSYTAD